MLRTDNQLFHWLAVIFTVSALLILQAGMFYNFPIYGVTPNILLLFVVVTALTASTNHVLAVSLFSGLLLDLLSGAPDGLFVSTFFLTAMTLHFVVNNFLSNANQHAVLTVGVVGSITLFSLLSIIILSLLSWLTNPVIFDAGQILGIGLAINLLWGLILVYPVLWLHQFIENKFSKT